MGSLQKGGEVSLKHSSVDRDDSRIVFNVRYATPEDDITRSYTIETR